MVRGTAGESKPGREPLSTVERVMRCLMGDWNASRRVVDKFAMPSQCAGRSSGKSVLLLRGAVVGLMAERAAPRGVEDLDWGKGDIAASRLRARIFSSSLGCTISEPALGLAFLVELDAMGDS